MAFPFDQAVAACGVTVAAIYFGTSDQAWIIIRVIIAAESAESSRLGIPCRGRPGQGTLSDESRARLHHGHHRIRVAAGHPGRHASGVTGVTSDSESRSAWEATVTGAVQVRRFKLNGSQSRHSRSQDTDSDSGTAVACRQ